MNTLSHINTDALAFDSIRGHFQGAGKSAFLCGHSRDSHGMNPGSAAIADFHTGYDAAARTHSDIAARERVDARQGSHS